MSYFIKFLAVVTAAIITLQLAGCGAGNGGSTDGSAPQSHYTLTVAKSGAGSGTVTGVPTGINCGSACSASYNAGATVTLTAAPASGSTFTGWSGGCSGTSSTCNVSMDANKNITAAFNSSSTTTKIYTFTTNSDWGTVPAGWLDDSYTDDGASVHRTYRVTDFDNRKCLQIRSTANTWDRVKLYTSESFTDGIYDWRVYIPQIDDPRASKSIGAWLFSQDYYLNDNNAGEVDFEIGYGADSERASYHIPDGQFMAYMSAQRDDRSGTPYSTGVIAIAPGNWYVFRIILGINTNNNYDVTWLYKKEGDADFSIARNKTSLNYGPSTVAFSMYASVENFMNRWIGDIKPTRDFDAYYEYMSYTK